MTDLEYRVSKIKKKVYESRRTGKGYIIQSLSDKEVAALQRMRFVVKPWLYEIVLEFPYYFTPTDYTENIIRTLYYYKIQTKKYSKHMHLSDKKVKTCRDFGLKVRLKKYKIY